jgi:hypothetical protein
MSETEKQSSEGTPDRPAGRDEEHWAKLVSRLEVGQMPEGAVDFVSRRRLVGPVQGFGRLWQKTYRVRLEGADVSPSEVIRTWKEGFPEFWPKGGRFYGPLTGIAPGEVALLSIGVGGGLRLSTGVFVLYADEESFTFMTPEGHMFAAWITFSSHRDDRATVAQAHVLLRANDPLYELGMPIMNRKEDRFWQDTLRSLAAHFGVAEPVIDTEVVCVDRRRQWRNARNVWKNSGVRSFAYYLGAPFRAAARPFRRKTKAR